MLSDRSSSPSSEAHPVEPSRYRHSLWRTVHHRLAALLLREWSIAEGSLLLMGAFGISAVLGLLRQILFNAHFGVQWEASAYYAAFRLPETMAVLLTGGTLANAMIPVLLHVTHTQDKQAAQQLINLLLTTLLAVIVPATLLAMVAAPWFVTTLLAPGFDPQTSQLTTALTRVMLIELLLLVVVSVANAVLMSRNQFLLPALGIAIHNFTLISGILGAMRFPAIGVYGPTIGAVTDAALQLCILIPGLTTQGIRFRPVWDIGNQHLREVIRLLIPSGLSGVVNYAGGILDTAFASLARETGSIPALHNAFLLFGVPVRLLGMAIGQAAFPRLAAHFVDAEWTALRRTLLRSLGGALSLAVLTTLGMLLFGRWGIRIIFEHGQFDAAAGTLTYTILVAYALALPAAIGTEILTRCSLALHDTRTPLIVNWMQLASRAALIPLLLPHLGVIAIPAAFAVSATLETIALAGIVTVKLRRAQAARTGVRS